MSALPADLAALLPTATVSAWTTIAPLVPGNGYLVGGTALTVHLGHRISRDLDFFVPDPFDPEELIDILQSAGEFRATRLEPGTLNGVFAGTKVQFLDASGQRVLAPALDVAGIRVASLADVFATKLKVIADRGELRDYFDLLVIEQKSHLAAEAGLGLFVQRYRPRVPEQAVARIVLGLGYLEDVADDPTLPLSRTEIETYWRRRQPEISQSWRQSPA